jgi:hypothetical protein
MNDPIAAVSYFLPSLARPDHASDLDWNNHVFGLTAIICEYIQFVRSEPLHLAINQVYADLLKKGIVKHLEPKMLKQLKKEGKQQREKEKAARLAQLEAVNNALAEDSKQMIATDEVNQSEKVVIEEKVEVAQAEKDPGS